MQYVIGIDLGGMSAKGGLFSVSGELLCEEKMKTNAADGFEGTVKLLAELSKKLTEQANVNFSAVQAIGVGAPEVVDSRRGVVLRWSNFNWQNAPLAERLQQLTGKKTYIANDANIAALGESKFGATSQYQSSILLTIGTGVGGGMVFDGELIEGY